MARKSRATGVGKGNGEGSRRTQFSHDDWPGNRAGRPRKTAGTLKDQSIAAAMVRELNKPWSIEVNGVKTKIPAAEAMSLILIEDFKTATTPQKIMIRKYFESKEAEQRAAVSYDIPTTTVARALEDLLREIEVEEQPEGAGLENDAWPGRSGGATPQ